ncbi:Uncharacterized protein R79673_LOCUS1183 [Commensalibacter communis]|uniref:Contains phage Mu head morphogenesis gpF-like domain n=1 Tax=Commensalibacter communis TaxID=2972786 RepID=A0A9W4XIV6_9PROT|nr:phage minor head protein [Commensalibacter communis]CAI3941922.1 Uncharacterized protein R79673_LOCUS1183 [Commensalibacter communis]CAI3944714.1 Uncharacterized protein R79671_LOCUS1355 [Commensalibacter communis]CAI3958924.1 Uncharacterized protein R53530_LOCUS2301 [Commensalibacter communis]CAI3961109.1 Uncharacterized protein R53529_LOCUS2326 [Commensalibacter communis]
MKRWKKPQHKFLKAGEILLRPIQPNVGVNAFYYRELLKAIQEMDKSISYWLTARYDKHEEQITGDIDPISDLASLLKKLASKWQERFANLSKELPKKFISLVVTSQESAFRASLKNSGFEFSFKPTIRQKQIIKAATIENVELINSIPNQYFDQIHTMVMNSVMQGGDLGGLTKELQNRFQITKRRAALIARDQNQKVFSTLNVAASLDAGITEGIWRHSPLRRNARKTHLEADGKRFNLEKGLSINGKYTQPGQEINCNCTYVAIIPENDGLKPI